MNKSRLHLNRNGDSILSSNFAKALCDIFNWSIEASDKVFFLESKVNNSITVNASRVISFLPRKDLNKLIIAHTLFVLIFARANFKSICARKLVQIYAEKGYARNLIRTKIISFHFIHFELFQKLLFWFKGNIYFFIIFKKNWHARKLIRAKKTYIAVARKLVHAKKFFLRCAKVNTREN